MNSSVKGSGSIGGIIRGAEREFLHLLKDLFRRGGLRRSERELIDEVVKFFEAPAPHLATIDTEDAVPRLRAIAAKRSVETPHSEAMNAAANELLIRARAK